MLGTQENYSHHAYLVEGGIRACDRIMQDISARGVQTRGNPDVHIHSYDVFGIDEARELKRLESRRAAQGGKKIFLYSCNSVTHEAQNSLLKLFEEPNKDSLFFLCVPSLRTLLPTLLSRAELIFSEKEQGDSMLAEQFLSASPAERIALVADIIEEKDKKRALELVNSIEHTLYSHTAFSSPQEVPIQAFEVLENTRSYLLIRSSSVKILLEHVSLSLPHIV